MRRIIDNNELLTRCTGEEVEWYPSAGDDMENVWSAFKHDKSGDPKPTLFIHTDWRHSVVEWNGFPDEIRGHGIVLTKTHEYVRLPAEGRGFCVFGKNGAKYSGACIEYSGKIEVCEGNVCEVRLIRIAIENEQFAAEFLLPHQISLEALVHKNYGWGCGGGAAIPGTWMRAVLGRLHVKYFLSDMHGLKGTRKSDFLCDENNRFIIGNLWMEQCRPGEYEASREYPILMEPPGTVLRLSQRWTDCWEYGSPHGFVTCCAVQVSPCKIEAFEHIVVKGHEIPVLNNFFDLIRYAKERRICVRPCSECWNYPFKCLCQEFGHDKLLYLIKKVTDEDIHNADYHPVLHRWCETIDILSTATDFMPFPTDSALGRCYGEICRRRAEEEVRCREELALKEKMRREEHARKVAEHIRAHKTRQLAYKTAWEERCKRMNELSLEGKLRILADDSSHLPDFYPIDLSQISRQNIESVSRETRQKLLARFMVLRRRDWKSFREMLQEVDGNIKE